MKLEICKYFVWRRLFVMTKKLRDYFPMLQTREAILKEINNTKRCGVRFIRGKKNGRRNFLIFALERGE